MAGAPARAHEDYCNPDPRHVRDWQCLSSVINCTRVVVSVSYLGFPLVCILHPVVARLLVCILTVSLHVWNKRLPLSPISEFNLQRINVQHSALSLDFARTCRARISRPSRFVKRTV